MGQLMEGATLDDLYGFIDAYGAWARETFPQADEASIIAHLRAEANKELEPGCHPSELADVFLLLVHLAYYRRHELDLPAEVIRKARRNMQRKWAVVPNAEGFFPHTKEAPCSDS